MPLTTIASFREAHSAHIVRAKLEAAGIPVFVTDEHLVGVQWFYSDAIGGVKLQVPDGYAEQARELVTADFSREIRSVRHTSRVRAPDVCPACGGEAGARTAVAREATAGERRFVVWSNRSTCGDCGHTW